MVTEFVGSKFHLVDFKHADAPEVPQELALRKGQRRGQKAFVDTPRMDRKPSGRF